MHRQGDVSNGAQPAAIQPNPEQSCMWYPARGFYQQDEVAARAEASGRRAEHERRTYRGEPTIGGPCTRASGSACLTDPDVELHDV